MNHDIEKIFSEFPALKLSKTSKNIIDWPENLSATALQIEKNLPQQL